MVELQLEKLGKLLHWRCSEPSVGPPICHPQTCCHLNSLHFSSDHWSSWNRMNHLLPSFRDDHDDHDFYRYPGKNGKTSHVLEHDLLMIYRKSNPVSFNMMHC